MEVFMMENSNSMKLKEEELILDLMVEFIKENELNLKCMGKGN